jgi:hypothetical protein
MADTCPTCLGSSVHKLKAYPQEFDLPSLSDHRSADQTRPQGSMQLLPEASYELGTSIRNDSL